MVIALWNLPPKATAGAGTVDEKMVKCLRERSVEGYYLKASCQACVTHELKIDIAWESTLRKQTCPVLGLPWTAASDHRCRKKTGLGQPLVWTGGAACWEHRQLLNRQLCDMYWPEELNDTRAGSKRAPSDASSCLSSGCTEISPPRGHQLAWAEFLAVITGMFPVLSQFIEWYFHSTLLFAAWAYPRPKEAWWYTSYFHKV